MTNDTIENRLEILTAEVAILRKKVENLETYLNQGVSSLPSAPTPRQPGAYSPPPEVRADALWSKVGQSSILSKIAAICFVLAAAVCSVAFNRWQQKG